MLTVGGGAARDVCQQLSITYISMAPNPIYLNYFIRLVKVLRKYKKYVFPQKNLYSRHLLSIGFVSITSSLYKVT